MRTTLPTILMEGAEVFRRAVTAMSDSSARALAKAGVHLDDVDLLIPHQANVRIIDATARRLSLDPAKVFVNIAAYGNTSAATIPIALAEALEEGRIAGGQHRLHRLRRRFHLGGRSLSLGNPYHPTGNHHGRTFTEHRHSPRTPPRTSHSTEGHLMAARVALVTGDPGYWTRRRERLAADGCRVAVNFHTR